MLMTVLLLAFLGILVVMLVTRRHIGRLGSLATLIAAAALVPEAVRPSPARTSVDTNVPPMTRRRRERGDVDSMRILPLRSSMVCR